jgi:hypothetical protein
MEHFAKSPASTLAVDPPKVACIYVAEDEQSNSCDFLQLKPYLLTGMNGQRRLMPGTSVHGLCGLSKVYSI